ncbi:MAG: pyridoxal phosphate-dependent aminotransferase [Lachnospiraceae bacterium]|nr:pyridoxal phosphate-dependent aminotransferase [Lachnospiraceae bacterium]
MAERNLDFDTIIDRRNTNSLKYDFAGKYGMPEDVLPLWVADMDFRISSYIQDAVRQQAEHGIFGYSEVTDAYFDAVRSWIEKHYGWKISPEWMVNTPGVVFALSMAIKAFTNVGDKVLIQQPVYYPFREAILDNKRVVLDNSLVKDEEGRYHMDFQDFEEKIKRENVKLFILCNPHNPVGRVWTREELIRIGDICFENHVIVVSDEIHADFVWEGKHQTFADLKEEYREHSVICTSPSKTFNIAGLQVSNIFIPNIRLRHQFKKQMDASGYRELNAIGYAACETAYRHGEEWYQAVCEYIKDNITYTEEFIKQHLPEIKMTKPEGTYLVWLDFRDLALSPDELEKLIVQRAGLWLDDGSIFGEEGRGFQRINAACPRETLKKALEKLEKAVYDL